MASNPGEATQPADLVSLDEAAEDLGVVRSTVRKWIENGDITGYRQGKFRIFVSLREAQEFYQVRPMELDPKPAAIS